MRILWKIFTIALLCTILPYMIFRGSPFFVATGLIIIAIIIIRAVKRRKKKREIKEEYKYDERADFEARRQDAARERQRELQTVASQYGYQPYE